MYLSNQKVLYILLGLENLRSRVLQRQCCGIGLLSPRHQSVSQLCQLLLVQVAACKSQGVGKKEKKIPKTENLRVPESAFLALEAKRRQRSIVSPAQCNSRRKDVGVTQQSGSHECTIGFARHRHTCGVCDPNAHTLVHCSLDTGH